MSNLVYTYHFSVGSADTKTVYCIADAPIRLKAVRINSTGLVAHATNAVTLTVLKGSDTICSRTTDTDTSGHATLVADTAENLTLAHQDELYLNAGEFFKITYVATGTVALNFAVNLHCESARDLS